MNDPSQEPVELSFVIPVYNGSRTVGAVVDRIHEIYADLRFEVVLVNDGSTDDSERACAALAERHAGTLTFVHLARNFGEHAAALAGMSYASGAYVAVLDDDPTGTQTVHDLWVITRWTREALLSVMSENSPVFYVLTNSRSLPQDQAAALSRDIAANLAACAAEVGAEIDVVSRSDSTLRGHYPAEIDARLGREREWTPERLRRELPFTAPLKSSR